jgi:hypothetical protein
MQVAVEVVRILVLRLAALADQVSAAKELAVMPIIRCLAQQIPDQAVVAAIQII